MRILNLMKVTLSLTKLIINRLKVCKLEGLEGKAKINYLCIKLTQIFLH